MIVFISKNLIRCFIFMQRFYSCDVFILVADFKLRESGQFSHKVNWTIKQKIFIKYIGNDFSLLFDKFDKKVKLRGQIFQWARRKRLCGRSVKLKKLKINSSLSKCSLVLSESNQSFFSIKIYFNRHLNVWEHPRNIWLDIPKILEKFSTR